MNKQSFIAYWDAVDAALMKGYALDTSDAGIEPEELAVAQDSGWSAKDFVKWFADKHGLTPVGGSIDLVTKTRIASALKD